MGRFEAFIGVNFWTALMTLGNFLLVLFVGRKYLYGPVLNMIQSRQQEIDEQYERGNQARKQAEELQKNYQQKLTEAHATSERIVKEAVARGQAREEEILRNAHAEAAAILDKASARIATERTKAVNDAKNEISVLAVAIAGKVVGRSLIDADHSRLVDSFIDELGGNV